MRAKGFKGLRVQGFLGLGFRVPLYVFEALLPKPSHPRAIGIPVKPGRVEICFVVLDRKLHMGCPLGVIMGGSMFLDPLGGLKRGSSKSQMPLRPLC